MLIINSIALLLVALAIFLINGILREKGQKIASMQCDIDSLKERFE